MNAKTREHQPSHPTAADGDASRHGRLGDEQQWAPAR